MRGKKTSVIIVAAAVAVLFLSIWGPENLANYTDRTTLNHINSETVDVENEGYKYKLDSNEKLYILSRCLDVRSIEESELSMLTLNAEQDSLYNETVNGTYAFVINKQGPSELEIDASQIMDKCNEEIEELKRLGIMPKSVGKVTYSSYSAEFYSAIDVLEPRNNFAVWKVSIMNDVRNADKTNRVIDVYVDADSGKIYEFYARGELDWDELDKSALVEKWSEYLGLYGMEKYDSVNPLLETTPNFVKYKFPTENDNSTIVTLGFYEGIEELFLKISK